MSLQPKSYEDALARKQASDARRRAKPGKQMKRGGRIKSRFNKKPSVDGDSERAIRDDCDQLVREIIKLRDSVCITCGTRDGTLHVGHLFRRGITATRWSLTNCNGQCDSCNGLHEEEPEHYITAYKARYGAIAYEALEIHSRSRNKLQYVELLAIRNGLRSELAQLKEKA